MARYSKLIAAILGNILGAIIGIVLGYLASVGLGACGVDMTTHINECAIAGHSQAEITAWLMAIIMGYVNAQAVYSFPPNTKVVAVVTKPASGKK